MATTLSTILLRLQALAVAHLPPDTTVTVSRPDPFSRAESPSCDIRVRGDGDLSAFSDDMDLHEDHVELHFLVRDDSPVLALEALHEAVHAHIVNDAQLAALANQVRLVGPPTFTDPEEADATAMKKVARYRFIYTTSRNAL